MRCLLLSCLAVGLLVTTAAAAETLPRDDDPPLSDGDVTEVEPAADQGEWIELFDGDSIDGWIQHGGRADFAVVDGTIVGTTRPGTPNSFLATAQEYSDFVLEFEFKVDPRMNSGVQFRSQSREDFKDGRVHGYQVEIDPSERAWTGGIYDEARRGWLFTLENRPEARAAFKQDQWNQIRVEARGDSIRTWVNGVPAAELKDDRTPSGFIALQVHSTRSAEPLQVSWRNLRLKEL